MSGSKMNGSVDLLAKAMRSVFTEAVAEGVQPVKDAVDGLKKDVDKRMDRVDSHLADLSTRVTHHQKALGRIKNRMPKGKRWRGGGDV